MKLTIFFISRTKQICAKTLAVSESPFKLKTMWSWTLSEILFASAVICKQRLLSGNRTVQCIQNCKCQDINQGHFKNSLQTPWKTTILRQPIHFSRGVQFVFFLEKVKDKALSFLLVKNTDKDFSGFTIQIKRDSPSKNY